MKIKLLLFTLIAIWCATITMAVPTISFSFNTSGPNTIAAEPSIIRASAAILQVVTERSVLCKYTRTSGVSYEAMEGSFDFNFGTIHKENLFGLTDGSYTYYVACRNSTDTGNNMLTSTFNVITPVSGRITLSRESPIRGGLVEISLVTSKPVQNVPSLSYSFNGVSYTPIALSGSGVNWQGHMIISAATGESVGSFSFSAQDLDGQTGNEIVQGSVFLVDTVKPRTIVDFDAVGYRSRVELNWHSDDDDIREYKVYRSLSPNVGYSNFYRDTTNANSYSDVSVEAGKTYYYRIIPVDRAGNEGEFSIEAYATALLTETNASGGLSPILMGQVDNSISSINIFLDDINQVEDSIDGKSEDERFIFEQLGMVEDIRNSKSELASLKSDVSKYKLQNLNQVELTNKLNGVELKINTIKKKIPEDLIISDKKEASNAALDSDVEKAIFSINPAIDGESFEHKYRNSLEAMKTYEFSTKSEIYNFEIVYLDGTRSKKALIRQEISTTLGENSSLSILEIIPKEIAESAAEIQFRGGNYQVLKDDPIISFTSETKEISYVLNKNVDSNLLKDVRTMLFYDEEPALRASLITGYFAFTDYSISTYGIIAGFAVFGLMLFYFYRLKSGTGKRAANELRRNVAAAHELYKSGKEAEAKEAYERIAQSYKHLDTKNKIRVYADVQDLIRKLDGNKNA